MVALNPATRAENAIFLPVTAVRCPPAPRPPPLSLPD
eukprot:CAMPEP_0171699308 /NCGR_PEP_ID=MMETSP0991-20121206/9885_1 /TAXON_ID=483369 /ORGANISM="non described non described, Strain CCMP2098" /LENGTH=36 /DNA_ID= /DNA_START= /DNA_END= /DNA_ORIENTATION=